MMRRDHGVRDLIDNDMFQAFSDNLFHECRSYCPGED